MNELGSGGYGKVYKGIHTISRKEFAIKFSFSDISTLGNEENIYTVRPFQYKCTFCTFVKYVKNVELF